ncbi:MAG: efflux RND transporter periplasmic adaptor subunit [Acidobacteriota bacterium]|nr:efflux RND transporter periplasmic adaptor subunit [Acidobacteriota bacterium]
MDTGPRLACAVLTMAGMVLAGCTGKSSTSPNSRKGGGDVPVTAATVLTRNVPVELQVIGNVEAYSTIALKAQVSGEITKAYFQEGAYVKKGESLFTIDPRAMKAQVQQAQATLARDQAQLAQAQANLARDQAQAKYSRDQAGRYSDLQKEGIVSKDQTEQLRSAADAAAQALTADQAAIESARAEIAAQKATVETMQVQFGYTEIKSPIDGRTGSINVKQGNIVAANTVDLMTINQVQPIYVTFSVPEAQLPEIKKYMAVSKLPVTAIPQDDPAGTETGILTFIDNAVDMSTGTIKLKGTFPNTSRKLWPGEFVRVTLRLTVQQNALVVPSQAVQTGQDGPFVFVINNDRSVENRPVSTGARVDQDLVIESGLRAGESVVTEGQLRLAPGMKVMIRQPGGGPGNGGGGRRRPG